MSKKQLFLIMEVDLVDRFSFFQKTTNIKTHALDLKNSLKQSKLSTVLSRLTYNKNLQTEYEKLKEQLAGVSQLFISNPEGYIAKNIIYFLRRDYPNLKIVSLQHGIFSLAEESKIKKSLKLLVNFCLKPILGYFVIGDGFGDITTDRYIVYNSLYKDFLIKKGWDYEKVIISSFFLKGEVETKALESKKGEKAVFFLQCLHKLGITDHDSEMKLIKSVTDKLSKTYSEVLIKQHPYAAIKLPVLAENCIVIKDLPELKEIGIIVSAFSTALLEFEKYGIPCVAIKYSQLNVNLSVYDQFLNIHDFDNSTNDDFDYYKNSKRENLPVFFETGVMNLEQI